MSSPQGPNPNVRAVKVKRPASIVSWNNGNWGPASFFRYKVRYGDNWWSIANKDGWADPMDLIELNFKTRNPKEINWYLRNFVGCTHASPGGNNFVFTDALKPGYIYTVHKLQDQAQVPTVPSRPVWPDPAGPEEPNLDRPGYWVGVGAKAGAFAAAGYEHTEAIMISSDYTDYYRLGIDTLKFGGGAGAGYSTVLVIASNIPTLADLKYCVFNGMDWNFSIVGDFKAMGKTAANYGVLRSLAASVWAGQKNHKLISEGATALKAVVGTKAGFGLGTMPSLTLVDIPFLPFSGGVEISLYSGRSTCSVTTLYESDTTIIEKAQGWWD